MNKRKLIVLFMAALTLGACTTEDDPGETEGLDPIEEEAAIEDEPNEAIITEEDLAPVSDEELEQAELVENLDEYEEFAEQDGFDPNDYDAYLVSEGTRRVFVFMEGDVQIFKTIYVEEDNSLEIIDVANEQVIQNSPI
ncbi:hypothetical protein SAMN04488102_103229 [Alkalibacterium subtropicum]|uniref:Uncharacterized protein n=1 Tax=Alkalibacterium subtropicum TaxID=753702 RepID=A0A1I1GUV5_9LACT|nr:hypothetical protein [Alkalibacterium subtropicum]SFC15072.1 hypothetical protein SAMN04488102_103229 [Alkalibacterium subtropicum]